MPTYVFHNTETNEEFEEFMSISARTEFLEANPHIKQVITSTTMGISYNDAKKPDEGFRDILRTIKKAHPRGDVNVF
jgi:hypothetical protein